MKNNILLRSFLIFVVLSALVAIAINDFYPVFMYLNHDYVIACASTLIAFTLYRKQQSRKSFYESDEYKARFERYKEANPKESNDLMNPYVIDLTLANSARLVGCLSILSLAYFIGYVSIFFISYSMIINIYMCYSLLCTKIKKSKKK